MPRHPPEHMPLRSLTRTEQKPLKKTRGHRKSGVGKETTSNVASKVELNEEDYIRTLGHSHLNLHWVPNTRFSTAMGNYYLCPSKHQTPQQQ